jgi:hypothetical protein
VEARLSAYLRDAVYGGSSLSAVFRPPLVGGISVFLVLLPFAVRKDVERQKQLKYGRRLKGPELLTPRQFNKVVKGDGIGFKTDEMKEMIRIPTRAESQHIQFIGDTGAGKSALMFQVLRQVQGLGDSAIVYDPAREYVRRFYSPERGDVILNPLDKRCPYWGPAEELRSRSEAKALSVSLFQPPQDRKGEFFIESPQKIFAFLMAYGPTPDELVQWMSNPERSTAGSKARSTRTSLIRERTSNGPVFSAPLDWSQTASACCRKSMKATAHGRLRSGQKSVRVGSFLPRFPPSARRFARYRACGFASFLRRADEGTLSRLLVEVSIVLASGRSNGTSALRDAAAAYKIDTDAIALKVKQDFASKERGRSNASSVTKALPQRVKKSA